MRLQREQCVRTCFLPLQSGLREGSLHFPFGIHWPQSNGQPSRQLPDTGNVWILP